MSSMLAATHTWIPSTNALCRAADVGPASRFGRKILTIATPAAATAAVPRRGAAEAIVSEISLSPAAVVVIVTTDASLDYSDAWTLAEHELSRSGQ
ncbi:hypothetical protein ABT186_23180 [Streptomyces sp. NPDC001634]|uniref:hypothetical protein n=1 Tax=Streptomyces sp. NPDC001634 TaxID=3154390 RepID=UPI003328D98B